jgi:protease YdgD
MQAAMQNNRPFRFAGRIALRAIALTALALLCFKPASTTAAELKVIDSAEAPWTSIGRVNFAGFKSTTMCTGTLIAPDLVLTAAHCLYNKSTGRPLPVDDLLFIAGVRRDEYSARLVPACVLIAQGYEPAQKPKLQDIHKDVAVIVLKEPSTLQPVPVLAPEEAAILTRETRFQSAGYRRSRRFLPTVVPACRVLGTTEESWVTDCASEAGASGGPLLVATPNGLRVAGIMSARIDDLRSAIVPFYGWQDLLADPHCPAQSPPEAPPLRPSVDAHD